MENLSVYSSYYYRSPSPFNITLGILYLLIIVVGITGNSLIVSIVYRNKNMHTTTNYLLSNLAIADFLSLVFCPIPLAVDLSNRHISGLTGQFVCKVFTGNFLSQFAISTAFTSLIFLATERYHAIVKPFDARFKLKKDNIGFAIGATWFVSLLCCIPIITCSEFKEAPGRCLNPWTIENATSMKPYIMAVALTFASVTCLLIYCYSQILRGIYVTKTVCSGSVAATDQAQSAVTKKKLAVASISVTVSFCICYTPTVLLHVYLAFESVEVLKQNYETLYILHSVARYILYLGSSLNPLIYAFQSSRYRDNLKQILTAKKSSKVGVFVFKDR